MKQEGILFKISSISLAIVGVAIFLFGSIVSIWPGSNDPLFLRAIGVASVGMGLFGVMITLIPFRRRERWAWWTLWYYPIFWSAHLFAGLPPGEDHIHQVVFIVLSLASLILSMKAFFQRES